LSWAAPARVRSKLLTRILQRSIERVGALDHPEKLLPEQIHIFLVLLSLVLRVSEKVETGFWSRSRGKSALTPESNILGDTRDLAGW